jgi:hypothetical protein
MEQPEEIEPIIGDDRIRERFIAAGNAILGESEAPEEPVEPK